MRAALLLMCAAILWTTLPAEASMCSFFGNCPKPGMYVYVPPGARCTQGPTELVAFFNGRVRNVYGPVAPGTCVVVPPGEEDFVRTRCGSVVSGRRVDNKQGTATCAVSADFSR